MSKWECIVCGWVYDEATGDPESGLAAGTKFDDIPDDWLCPDCGVGKEDFELIAGSETAPVVEDTPQLVVATAEPKAEVAPVATGRKWECIVCGWVYDEAIGDPESGLAAGTKFEDIPDDWLCPDCGVGKEDFELIGGEEAPAVAPAAASANIANAPVVILGTGLAGYGLAREFRKLDKETPLLLITSDDGRSYSKPMLSTGYTKNTTADDLAMSEPEKMAEQLNATIKTHTVVDAIDTAGHSLTLAGGATQAYKKLVLAIGADTIRPPIGGDAADQVYSINDLMDYAKFRTAMQAADAKKVCIIGGGLIGCEFTNDLLNGGFETETIDPLAYCLPTLLPEPAGKAVQRGLEGLGGKFHFGPLVTEVNKTANGVAATLNSGETIDADVVISAVGVRARTSLAAASGIEVNRGIKTNRLLETSAPDVYAFGDCAEVEGHVLFYVLPLMAASRALAKTLSGEATEVVYPAMPVAIKTPACPVVVSPPERDAAGDWQIEEDGNNVTAKFVAPNGDLLGFALTGDATKQKMALQKQLPALLS